MIQNPEVFWYLLVLIPILLIAIFRYKKGKSELMILGGIWREGELKELYIIKWFFSFLSISLFVVFLIFALSGLQGSFSGEPRPSGQKPKDTNIIFLLDVSRSMRADDILPSRLEKSTALIQGLVEQLKGSKFGITVFKGMAVQIIPLTEDIESIMSFLESVTTEIITSPGSNIEKGIDLSVNSFTKGEERRQIVIMFSDGESLSGNPERAAVKARKNNIMIYTIGAGTIEGGTISLSDSSLVKDNSGNIVITHLEEFYLKRIAEITDGKYYHLSDPAIYNNLLSAINKDFSAVLERGEDSILYRGFLITAIIFLFFHLGIRTVKWKKLF